MKYPKNIIPKITYTNFKKSYPIGPNAFKSWFSIQRYWSGSIISISIKHHNISLDFRKDWISDMTNGKVKAPTV